MFFEANSFKKSPALTGHWDDLWSQRAAYNAQHDQMLAVHRSHMTNAELQMNAPGGFARDFWAALDNQIIELRDQETGMEIVTDLMSVQTVLPVGKTAKLYNVVGNIADDVSVSLDGQAPYSFDHLDYAQDGDPIPMFSAGFGANWRHVQGLNTEGIDIILDSQRAKTRKFNKAIVNYMLNGNPDITVSNYPAQGLKNHRNTKKINLTTAGAAGAAIDLTTATPEAVINFFQGAFGSVLDENKVTRLSTLWVSPEIDRNLNKAVANGLGGFSTVREIVARFIRADRIEMTFALSGNEFLGYVKSRDIVSPLVGMATGIVPLPRPLPQTNLNFQLLGAFGLQVKADGEQRGGVVYGANLT